MRVYDRESLPEEMLPVADDRDRLIEIEAIIDLTGRVKVNRVFDGLSLNSKLGKPTRRFAILIGPKDHLA